MADFAKLVDLFDEHGISFVSVTQQFNTTSSMGRLTLNVLLSFAQFEREVTGERIRDKIAASKRKGLWMGGLPPVGYRSCERTLVIDTPEAERIRAIFQLYLDLGCIRKLKQELDRRQWVTPKRKSDRLNAQGGRPFSRGHLYRLLANPIYFGQIAHKAEVFAGQHLVIIDAKFWQAVQDQLASNRQGQRTQCTAAHPSLLTGLLFDDQGRNLTPSHAQKGARRYRYSIRQDVAMTAKDDTHDVLRVPAQELEEAVCHGIIDFLKDETRLLGLMENLNAGTVRRRLQQAAAMADQWIIASTSEQIDLLHQIIVRIMIHPYHLEITIRPGTVWSTDQTRNKDQRIVKLEIPIQLKRCGMAVRLIVQALGAPSRKKADPKLVALVTKAQIWFARLRSGQCESIQALAQAEQVSGTYIARVLNLAFLDPAIIEQILRGDHSPEFNAMRLIHSVPLPMAWPDQRTHLGLMP